MKTLYRSLSLTILLSLLPADAATTIHSTNAYAYGANIGWINFRGDGTNGVSITDHFCHGYAYSANVGWISLGTGTPINGYAYANNSSTDYGVNLIDFSNDGTTWEAKLRGFAYGANIGWIHFETLGNPRINLATGRLHGHAYAANIGWIALDGTNVNVETTSMAVPDTDGDGISDSWEMFHAQNLTALDDTLDRDGDGVSDLSEFLADTDPDDGSDFLEITDYSLAEQIGGTGPYYTMLQWTSQLTRKYTIEANEDLGTLWGDMLTGIVPTSGATTSRTIIDSDATRRFYQIHASLPLTP